MIAAMVIALVLAVLVLAVLLAESRRSVRALEARIEGLEWWAADAPEQPQPHMWVDPAVLREALGPSKGYR